MPGRMDFAVARHQHHDVEPLGTPQRVDRLLRSLGNGARDIEGRVDRKLDAVAISASSFLSTRPSMSRAPLPKLRNRRSTRCGVPRGFDVVVLVAGDGEVHAAWHGSERDSGRFTGWYSDWKSQTPAAQR